MSENKPRPVRFAIVGSNFITEKFLAAAPQSPGFVLDTFYSRSPDRAREFAARFGAPHAESDWQRLLASDTVDAVYLATPNACHAQQACALLAAGKHVLCEKPAACSAAELEQMLGAAQTAGRVLMEAMRPAHLPALAALREGLARVGTVRHVSLSYCQYSSRYDKFKNGILENAFRPELGNGALMDIGVYCVNLALLLFGAPRRILAAGSFLPGAIDACGSAVWAYDGFEAVLSYSKVHQSNVPGAVEGENGTLFLEPVPVPAKIWFEARGGGRELVFDAREEEHDMRFELDDFLAAVSGRLDPAPWQQLSRTAARCLDEMRAQIGIDFAPGARQG